MKNLSKWQKWFIIGLVSSLLTGLVIYIAIPKQFKDPKGYALELEQKAKALEEQKSALLERLQSLKLDLEKIDSDRYDYNLFDKNESLELKYKDARSEFQNINEKVRNLNETNLKTLEKEFSDIENNKIKPVIDEIKTLKETIIKEKADKEKAERELLANITEINKKTEENYNSSAVGVAQEQANMKLTVDKVELRDADDNNVTLAFHNIHDVVYITLENKSDKDITFKASDFYAERTAGMTSGETPETEVLKFGDDYTQLKDTVVLKPGESKKVFLAYAVLNPNKYGSGYAMSRFYYKTNNKEVKQDVRYFDFKLR